MKQYVLAIGILLSVGTVSLHATREADLSKRLQGCISLSDVRRVVDDTVKQLGVNAFFYCPKAEGDAAAWEKVLDQLAAAGTRSAGWVESLCRLFLDQCTGTAKHSGIGGHLSLKIDPSEQQSSCQCKRTVEMKSASDLTALREQGSGVVGISISISRTEESDAWKGFIERLSRLVYRRRNMRDNKGLDRREVQVLNWVLQEAQKPGSGIDIEITVRCSDGTPGDCCCGTACRCGETYRGMCPCGVTDVCYCVKH